jgi:hypothetical protein
MEEFFAIPTPFVSIVIYGGCLIGFRWALEPLDCAAKERQCALQFNLADILCLFVPVQLSLGIGHWAIEHIATHAKEWEHFGSHAKEWEWDIGIVVAMALVWWYLVRMLCPRTYAWSGSAASSSWWPRCLLLPAAPY